MLDPLLIWILSICFAVLFIMAGIHKATNKAQFHANLAAYQLVPVILIPLLTTVVPLFEIFLGLAWIGRVFPAVIPLLTALLLTIYTLAIGINLLRGRSYIDCGCGFSSSTRKNDSGEIQQLSTALVLRNALLIGAALMASFPTTDRLLGFMDFFGVVIASIVFMLLYMAFNQLMMNNSALGSWRHSHG